MRKFDYYYKSILYYRVSIWVILENVLGSCMALANFLDKIAEKLFWRKLKKKKNGKLMMNNRTMTSTKWKTHSCPPQVDCYCFRCDSGLFFFILQNFISQMWDFFLLFSTFIFISISFFRRNTQKCLAIHTYTLTTYKHIHM